VKYQYKAYIGLAISSLFILLVLKQVDLTDIGQAVKRTNHFWLIVALFFYWVEILLRILRWKRILTSVDSTIQYSSIRNSFCISAAANNIFPLRLGDILRAHLVGIQRNISRYSLMGTIVLEKLIDVVAVFLLTFCGAFGVLSQLGALTKLGFVFLMVVGSIVVLGGIYLLTKNGFLSNKLMMFFHERLKHFKRGFGILRKPKSLLLVIVETILLWAFNTLAIWAIIKSFGVTLSTSEVLLLEGITGLSAAIPSAPAGIGTLQYAFLLTFGILQLDKTVGVAASLLLQVVLLGSITLVGVLIFSFDSRSRHAFSRIKHE
jgi:hypothetical protein